MASGTLGNTFQTGYRLQIDWESIPNENNMTSKVTARIYLVTQPHYNIITSVNKVCKVTINGHTTTWNVNTNIPRVNRVTKKLLATKVRTISHNSNTGQATVSINGSLAIMATLSGRYYGTVSIPSRSFNLDTIETSQFYYATGGSWRRAKGVYYATGGGWRKVQVYQGTDGSWKKTSN